MLCYLRFRSFLGLIAYHIHFKVICLQEISEINSKPSARYALALFSLCREGKTNNEVEKHVLNLLEVL